MNKIGLIIKREYLSRVQKKSFIIMTILGPLLLAGVFLFIIWLGLEDDQHHKVLVIDQKYPVFETLEGTDNIEFTYGNYTIEQAKKMFYESPFTAILFIPENVEFSNSAILYFKKQPGLTTLKTIESRVEKVVEELKLQTFEIDKETFFRVKTNFNLLHTKYSVTGEEEQVDIEKNAVGFVFGLFIYMFIFLYGVQVMRGVIEEKTNRIVEVIISSVKPFQLMMGKIVGVAMVGLTQFLIWVVFTAVIYSIAFSFFIDAEYSAEAISKMPQMSTQIMQESEQISAKSFVGPDNILSRINFPLMLSMFLFYFLGGYLLYSALFAAIGSAVDSETDTQQFMLPVTLPLVAAYIISIMVVQNPESSTAFWFSIIPFTSPIVMMVRLAVGIGDGGIPIWEVAISMGLLIITFIFMVWLAGKIYRVGILMYGKKPTFKELYKWIFIKP